MAGDPMEYQINWNSGQTYPRGQVILSGGNLFLSLDPSNVNHDPLTSPAWWKLIGDDGFQQTTPGGRLTLVDNTPVPPGSVTGNTIYYEPFLHNQISLWTGVTWWPMVFTNVSTSLSASAANTNYDIFASINVTSVVLQTVAWSSGTARATALTLTDGVYTKAGAKIQRYLGTVRKAATECQDTSRLRWVYNYYNRVPRSLLIGDATASWTYNGTAWRAANNSTGNSVSVLVGLPDLTVDLDVICNATTTTASALVAIGVDSFTPSGIQSRLGTNQSGGNLHAKLQHTPASIGVPFYYSLEACDSAANVTFNGANYQAITGMVPL